MKNIKWTSARIGTCVILFGQLDVSLFEKLDKSRRYPWVEIIEGSSCRYIVRRYIETEAGSDKCTKEVCTNTWATDDSPRGKLARELGMPGAGYVIELGEKMLQNAHGRR